MTAKICICPRDTKLQITERLADCPIHGQDRPKPEVYFMCCFCGQECPGETQLALIQNVGTDEQQEQFWFCHFGCFEGAIAEKARIFAGEDDDDWEVEGGEA